MLKFDENIGAKQAFSFFINTIPGNPHPALSKQIPLFQQFMRNLDHPLEEAGRAEGIRNLVDRSKGLQTATTLADEDVPIVNGRLESTWRIDRESHTLAPNRGITFDRERPVLSSTSSWLMGRNLAPLEDEAFEVLEMVDGQAPWSSIVHRYSEVQGLPEEQGRRKLAEIVDPLLSESFLLVRSSAQLQASAGPG